MDYMSAQLDAAQLPQLVRRAIMVSDQPAQCDMLLLSTLTALSHALPRYSFSHGRTSHTYHPALMTLVIAPPASGKGVMNLSRRLLRPLHDSLQQQASISGQSAVFLPANSTSAAFFAQLQRNAGRAFLMETEMDTLTAAWKGGTADFSYAFRQAFEHETISKARKKAGEENLEVRDPELSVLLSGTLGQLAPLLKSSENGLASRFIMYRVNDVQPFDLRAIHHPDEPSAYTADSIYDDLGLEVLALYRHMEARPRPATFCLTGEQATELRNFFSDGYFLAFDAMHMPVGFDPAVKRMVVSIMRIGMILSAVRAFEENGSVPDEVVCHPDDFRTMMTLAESLLISAGDVFLSLPSADKTTLQLELVTPESQLLAALPAKFTTAEAVAIGKENDIPRRSLERNISKLVNERKLVRIGKGTYQKV